MKIKTIIAALLFVIVALIVSASVKEIPDASVSNIPSETTEIPETTEMPETTDVPETTVSPETTVPAETTAAPETTDVPETTDAPETTEAPEQKEYDYSLPVPAATPVGKEFFDDAIFIGNSRTRGFLTQAGLSKPGAFAYVGLTVKSFFDDPIVKKGDTKITVRDAVAEYEEINKAYIMFGTNEIGWISDPYFKERYSAVIDELRNVDPDVEIYLQSILPVSAIYTPEHEHYYMYNMPRINRLNELVREIAIEKKVYFVNVAEVMTDEEGFLFADASRDGVHLNRDYCQKWLEYLMCHTVEEKNEKN